MRRLLLLLSALSLILLSIGTAYFPDYPAFWLASGETTYQTVRLILASALMIQFATHPPRNIYFRILCGFIAVGAAGWALEETYAYQMQYLDTMAILSASVATAVTALEINTSEQEVHETRKFIFVAG